VPIDQFITYAEACLRVYNRYGRRDNKYKARIKILVHELGKDEYTRQVEEEFAHLLTQNIEPPLAELERIKAHFADPAFETGLPRTISTVGPRFRAVGGPQLPRPQAARLHHRHHQPEAGRRHSRRCHGRPDPPDGRSGQATIRFDELRVMHAQNIVLPHVQKADLYALWQALDAAGLGTANLDTIERHHRLPGLDYCSLANARSIPRRAEDFGALRRSGPQREWSAS
jgi:sulfite reductase (NADPH) hemoprotein beta-component